MRGTRVWAGLLGLDGAVVEDVYCGVEGEVVVAVRPRFRERDRCGICRRRSPGFDLGDGRRRWRALDLGTTFAYVEALAPRVSCREHGVVVAAVPWARHGAGFTRSFEDQIAWLAVHTSKSAVAELARIAWRTVGRIVERVGDEGRRQRDLLAGLRRIGIDEISYRKGQRYLTVVVDHHTGRLVWAAAGANIKTLSGFFELLGEERCKQVELVSADMGSWIAKALDKHCPNAVLCIDPFHVVKLATDALDEIRREVWNEARRVRRDRGRQGSQGRAVRAVEEPRAPHRPPADQAREHPDDQPPALSRLPAQGAATPDLPTPRRASTRAPGPVAGMGPTLPPPRVRQARPHDHRAARRDLAAINTDSPTRASSRPTPRSASSPAAPSGSTPPTR